MNPSSDVPGESERKDSLPAVKLLALSACVKVLDARQTSSRLLTQEIWLRVAGCIFADEEEALRYLSGPRLYVVIPTGAYDGMAKLLSSLSRIE